MARAIYQIHVLLKHSKPKIWRRILINADDPLSELHIAIQYSMGWLNYHLHEFRKNGKAYSPKTDEDLGHWDDSFMFDYKNMKVSDIMSNENEKIEYEYDFGDGWEHEIKLEKILNIDGKLPLPLCIKGKMACPPEDCGGIWGYEDMLQGLKDPKHEMHREYREWIDPDFDPQAFDIKEANAQLNARLWDDTDEF